MKRSIALILTVSLLLAIAGCISNTGGGSTTQPVLTAGQQLAQQVQLAELVYYTAVDLKAVPDNPQIDAAIKVAAASITVLENEPAGTSQYQAAIDVLTALDAQLAPAKAAVAGKYGVTLHR